MEAYDFGLRLKALRENRNWSQEYVASKLGLNKSTISGYERNVTTPSLDVLKNLALCLNVTADYLLGITDREEIFLDDLSEVGKNAAIRFINEMRLILNPSD